MPAASGAPGMRKPTTSLVREGDGTLKLVVDGCPFLVLGGELHNSSSSSEWAIREAYARIEGLGLNPVLAPLAWNQLEPREGEYNFELIDALVAIYHEKGLRLVPLWFGAWKNGRSTYMPAWVREDVARFPRSLLTSQDHREHLSPFSPSVRAADAAAFAALMRHVREADGDTGTIIMVQVENETGLLGDSRDRSPTAEASFRGPVPEQVFEALESPGELRIASAWEQRGRRRSGSWTDVFGASIDTDEAFMAAAYAAHVQAVVSAGKAEYDIPMFVNAWLNTELPTADGSPAGGQEPGTYPSGGPLPHVAGLWRTFAPSVDLLAPDIYFGDFKKVCGEYQALTGGLFIPEMKRDEEGVGDAFVAVGSFAAIGVSPFGIDSIHEPERGPVTDAFRIFSCVAHLLPSHRAAGIHVRSGEEEARVEIGEFVFVARLEPIGGGGTVERGYGLIVEEEPGSLLVAGRGLHLRVRTVGTGQQAVLASVVELAHGAGELLLRRHLNGDETEGGTTIRLPALEQPPATDRYQIPIDRRSTGLLRVRVVAAQR